MFFVVLRIAEDDRDNFWCENSTTCEPGVVLEVEVDRWVDRLDDGLWVEVERAILRVAPPLLSPPGSGLAP